MNKNKVLSDLATLLENHAAELIQENKRDLANANELDPTLVDRLKVDEQKVKSMIASVQNVINIEDPEDQILSEYHHPNGMLVQNRVVPFGKILIIYESRPDVTIEAAISAFKAGNKIYLKGGEEAVHTNLFLIKLWHQALSQNNISLDYINYLKISREETQKLIKDNPYRIDLIIPRGGEGLINYIRSITSIPLLVSGRGNNFAYIHSDADFEIATSIILNGKSRLSVCNALDKVLINKEIENIDSKISNLINQLKQKEIKIYATNKLEVKNEQINPIENDEIFYEEFLSATILLDKVDNAEQAIQMINKYSGGHSATIICKDKTVANQFQKEVDCAAVFHNASTRFTDGGQFGFGAEIAISTQKLHFRGPVGLSQLVTNKWFVSGDGQVRD